MHRLANKSHIEVSQCPSGKQATYMHRYAWQKCFLIRRAMSRLADPIGRGQAYITTLYLYTNFFSSDNCTTFMLSYWQIKTNVDQCKMTPTREQYSCIQDFRKYLQKCVIARSMLSRLITTVYLKLKPRCVISVQKCAGVILTMVSFNERH